MAKILFNFQINDNETIDYFFNEKGIVKVQKTFLNEGQPVIKDFYLDTTLAEKGKIYERFEDSLWLSFDDDETLLLEVLCPIPLSLADEEKERGPFKLEIEEFDIPEDAVISIPKEIIFEEEGPSQIDILESKNRELELQLKNMEQQIVEVRRVSEETTLELLELMMGLL